MLANASPDATLQTGQTQGASWRECFKFMAEHGQEMTTAFHTRVRSHLTMALVRPLVEPYIVDVIMRQDADHLVEESQISRYLDEFFGHLFTQNQLLLISTSHEGVRGAAKSAPEAIIRYVQKYRMPEPDDAPVFHRGIIRFQYHPRFEDLGRGMVDVIRMTGMELVVSAYVQDFDTQDDMQLVQQASFLFPINPHTNCGANPDAPNPDARP